MVEGLRRTEASPAKQQESRPESTLIGNKEYRLGDAVQVRIARNAEGVIVDAPDAARPETGWTFAGVRDNGTLRLRSLEGEKIAVTKERLLEWQIGTDQDEHETEIKAAPPFTRSEFRKNVYDDRRGQAA